MKCVPWRLCILLLALQFSLLAAEPVVSNKTASDAAAIEGQRVFICGHSFHVYVAKPLEDLAKAAGIANHVNLGVQFLGGSSVTQHWDLPDEKNKAKQALNAGNVDVLTLSPNWIMPDPAMDRFVDLALQKNPNTRIIVQMSWMAFDAPTFATAIQKNEQRDTKTIEGLTKDSEPLRKIFEDQIKAINARHPKQNVYVAPVAIALMALRDKVIRGEAPGIAKQSDLFADPLGHGKEPIQRLCEYCYFAAIYRKSPVGLKVFEKPGNGNWNRLNQLLQQIAWDTVSQYPLSGVKP